MMRRFGYTLLSAVLLSAVGTFGYYVSEFLHLRVENQELRRIAAESIQLAEQRGDTASSCMSSLTACSRTIDAENPQIRDRLQQPDPKKQTQLAQQRGR